MENKFEFKKISIFVKNKSFEKFSLMFLIALPIMFILGFWSLWYFNLDFCKPINPFTDGFKFTIKEILSSNGLIAVSFLFIVIVTFIFEFLMLKKFLGLTNDLEDINNKLKNIKFIETVKDYDELKNIFRETSLNSVFNSFNKTLRRIREDKNEVSNIYSTVDSHYFFDDEIIYNKINTKLHNYIPQFLTAVGIFGTFLGLVIGLQNLNLDGAQSTQESIRLLIDGVKISFKSSLYGILFSMILSMYQKVYFGILSSNINKISTVIDSLLDKNTQKDGTKEIHEELFKQTSSLQSMATDFADVIGDKLESSFQSNLAPTLMKLEQSITQMANMSQSSNEKALQTLFENMQDMFSNAAQSEMDGLKQSLNQITSKNEFMFEKFSKSLEDIEALMENQRLVIDSTNESAGNVERTNEKMEILSSKLENMLVNLTEFNETQTISNKDSHELLEKIKDNIQYQNESNSKMIEVIDKNNESLIIQKSIQDNLQLTSSNLNKFNDQFQFILSSLMENMNGFRDTSYTINDKFLDTISKLEEHYENVNDTISSNIEKLNETSVNLNENIFEKLDNINNDFYNIINYLKEFAQKSDQISDKLTEFSDTQNTSYELWGSYKESFDNLNKEINSGITGYTQNVKDGTQDLFKLYDGELVKVFDNVKDLIIRLNEGVEEMGENIDSMKDYQKLLNESNDNQELVFNGEER